MKKVMIADLIKAAETEIQEESNTLETIEDIPEQGDIPFSIGSGEYSINPDGSYEVNLSFNLGGSATYTLDPDQLLDFLNDPSGSHYNSQIRLS